MVQDFHPYEQSFAADPYPVYARLRKQNPVFYSDEFGCTFLTRYADIYPLLSDKRFGRTMDAVLSEHEIRQKREAQNWENLPYYSRFVRVNLLETDGAAHGRLRRLLAKAINPKRIAGLSDRIHDFLDKKLDELLPKGEMEFLEELAVPLPVYVISELLGWPEEDRHRLRPWSADIVRLYEKDHTGDHEQRAETAVREFSGVLEMLVEDRLAVPRGDLVSALVVLEKDQQRLTHDELISSCMMLLNAGHEATVNAAGNGLLALLRNRDQMRLLKQNPGYIDTVVEEMLRYDPPLQFFYRYSWQPARYAGVDFKKGDMIGLLYGSACRDEAQYEHADQFDIRRDPNSHLAFGAGTHFCIGAQLARLELRALFSTLLRRLPDIALVDESPLYHTGLVFRGLKQLRVCW